MRLVFVIWFFVCFCDAIFAQRFYKVSSLSEIDDLRHLSRFAVDFLSSCTVTSSLQVRGLGECQGRCRLTSSCVALSFSKRNGLCVLCEEASTDGTNGGWSSSLRNSMVDVHALQMYFDCKNTCT